ncbi:Xylulose kinase [Planctomycetes bacterium Poly30]|uniref:Xylulose kinase n=2 Tax=Saltatorellus ferox TaxID=2528018 RepID=A0A518EQJ0_9BACT|nr:Xylulose kinase [Planctomycetes bacterium Poly30]
MEQHPTIWIDAIQRAVRAALADAVAGGVAGTAALVADRVRGIGVSGQQHGAVLLDAALEPVRAAKLWCDTSTAAEAREISAELGRTVPAGFTAPKLRYVARREPSVWEQVRHVALPHDYVNAWLSGDLFTEAGDASGTGYLREGVLRGSEDPYVGALDDIAAGLSEKVPRVLASNAVVATLRKSAADALGLREGIAISGGGGDNMMSAIGSGATRPGVVTCSLGTSGTVFAYSAEPLDDPTGAIAAFRSSSEGENREPGHLPLLCIMNCTSVLNEVCDLTGKGHGELTLAAEAVPPGCDGMLFVPYLVGERVPDLPNARGRLVGIPGSIQAAALYRAAMEGVSLSLGLGVDRMRELGLGVDEVRLVGGAAGNWLWRSVLADVFGCPVRLVVETETAAMGAALQVASAVAGDPSSDAMSQRVVALADEVAEPSSDRSELVAEMKRRFAAEVKTLS